MFSISSPTVAPYLVQVASNDIDRVFGYDPLMAHVASIARSQRFKTLEYVMAFMAQAWATYSEAVAMEICLGKHSMLAGDPRADKLTGECSTN